MMATEYGHTHRRSISRLTLVNVTTFAYRQDNTSLCTSLNICHKQHLNVSLHGLAVPCSTLECIDISQRVSGALRTEQTPHITAQDYAEKLMQTVTTMF